MVLSGSSPANYDNFLVSLSFTSLTLLRSTGQFFVECHPLGLLFPFYFYGKTSWCLSLTALTSNYKHVHRRGPSTAPADPFASSGPFVSLKTSSLSDTSPGDFCFVQV